MIAMWGRLRARAVRLLLLAALAAGVLVMVCVRSNGGSITGTHPVDGRSTHAKIDPPVTITRPVPPYPVETSSLVLVDPSRATPARGSVPAKEGRDLTTEIWRPVGPTGPLPLVVFAHGWNSNPGVYAPLLGAWAAAGYLVAAPVFPDSANTLPGAPVSDYPDQARDVSFVITNFLDDAAEQVDPARIAVAGHSDGGTDVALLALNPAYADHRIRAYLSLSGEVPSELDGPWGVPTPGTLLVGVGTDDEYGLLPRATQVYDTADMTKALLTVAGGDHLGTFVGPSARSQAVRAETVRFLQEAMGTGAITPAALDAALTPAPDPSITVAIGKGGS